VILTAFAGISLYDHTDQVVEEKKKRKKKKWIWRQQMQCFIW
jgi:hypothetical protein